MGTIIPDLYDWILSLSGEARFLFALPFVVAAAGLLADWWRRSAAHRKASDRQDRKLHAVR